jgi:hypothetical protein
VVEDGLICQIPNVLVVSALFDRGEEIYLRETAPSEVGEKVAIDGTVCLPERPYLICCYNGERSTITLISPLRNRCPSVVHRFLICVTRDLYPEQQPEYRGFRHFLRKEKNREEEKNGILTVASFFFNYKRAAFLAQLKSRVGLTLAKAATLRITLNLDGTLLLQQHILTHHTRKHLSY